MDTRIEELIAIGASIAANCQTCLEYHVQKAKENGADQQQISRAIEVGKMVRKGAAGKMDKVILNISRGTEIADAAPCND